MITYFIKSTICLALLLIFYHFVLEREKMHKFNRFYLLGSVLFSFLAPEFIIYVETGTAIIEATQEINPITSFSSTEIPVKKTITYSTILIVIYSLISSLFAFRFVKNLIKIVNKIRRNRHEKLEYATLVLVKDRILPHSFYNYIFINKSEYESNKLEPELLTHELTHVTQKHTLDILLMELLLIVFWINPLFIILKKAIQLNHEFLADKTVISTYKNTFRYQYLLLSKAAWNNEYYLASNLNYSLTKKRLQMMTTTSSKTNILLKKLAIIPLLAGFTFVFAERVEAQEIIEIVEQPENVQKNHDVFRSKLPTGEVIEIWEDKEPSASNNFLISVEKTENSIRLKCYDCYRWADLKLKLNTEYIINDFGFSEGKTIKSDKYTFTIKTTKNQVIFKGLKNTAWRDLTFTLNKGTKQFLNQNGMVSKKKEYLDVPTKRKSSKQSTSDKASTRDVKPKLEEVNVQKMNIIKKDSIKKPIIVKYEKISATKAEMDEYNSLVSKGKKDRSFKHKDILKMQYLYSLMSINQKKTVENYASFIPPPPPPKKEVSLTKNKSGFFKIKDKTYFYHKNDKNGETTYYNRWGEQVDKNGKTLKVSN